MSGESVDGLAQTSEPVLTSETHGECGSKLYRVGTDRILFCSNCSVQPDTDRTEEKQ